MRRNQKLELKMNKSTCEHCKNGLVEITSVRGKKYWKHVAGSPGSYACDNPTPTEIFQELRTDRT
jgi:hypothetical protein